jgi:hypothetical protein
VIGTPPVLSSAAWLSRPGTCRVMGDPGEKPSLRFHSSGWTGFPAALRGIWSMPKSIRLPVAVLGSGFVKKSFGNGWRQTAGSNGSHFGAALAAGAQKPASIATTSAAIVPRLVTARRISGRGVLGAGQRRRCRGAVTRTFTGSDFALS